MEVKFLPVPLNIVLVDCCSVFRQSTLCHYFFEQHLHEYLRDSKQVLRYFLKVCHHYTGTLLKVLCDPLCKCFNFFLDYWLPFWKVKLRNYFFLNCLLRFCNSLCCWFYSLPRIIEFRCKFGRTFRLWCIDFGCGLFYFGLLVL